MWAFTVAGDHSHLSETVQVWAIAPLGLNAAAQDAWRHGILKDRVCRLRKRLLAVASCAALLACGCGSTTYPNMTGDWTFAAISTPLPSEPPTHFTGSLTSSGNGVSGTLTFTNPCFNGQAIGYSGSLAVSNSVATVTLTSNAYNNQVVMLMGTVSNDGTLLSGGTYSVAAKTASQPICDAGDAGTLTGSRLAAMALAGKKTAGN